jgi:hypothetical protein
VAETLSSNLWALKACLGASQVCIAALRGVSECRPRAVAACDIKVETFTRRHQCEFSLCAPLLEPVGEAVDQAVPEHLDRDDKAWAGGNRVKSLSQ